MGHMDIPEGNTAGGFQLQFQAYLSDGGAWVLDQVRVVASPYTSNGATGLTELSNRPSDRTVPMYDVLGRPADSRTLLSISRDGKRRVVIE